MRVIAGRCRGRRLKPPQDQTLTRPITDRVKEAMFNRLQSLGVLAPGQLHEVVDLFCGTGSLGLEALSRGADRCTFVDADPDAINGLQHNLDTLGLTGFARVYRCDALSEAWLTTIPERSISLVMIDPPYAMTGHPDPRERVLQLLEPLIAKTEPGAVLVLRSQRGCHIAARANWDGPASITYGTMELHFFQRPFDESQPG